MKAFPTHLTLIVWLESLWDHQISGLCPTFNMALFENRVPQNLVSNHFIIPLVMGLYYLIKMTILVYSIKGGVYKPPNHPSHERPWLGIMVTWRSLLKKYPFNNIAFVASQIFTLLSSLGFKRSKQRHEVFEKARLVALLEGILSGSILDGYFRTWSFTTQREKTSFFC